MTSSEKTDFTVLPRAALLKSLKNRGEEFVTEESFSAIFDDKMLNDLLSLLDYYKTSNSLNSVTIDGLPDQKFKDSALQIARFTLLSKESLENFLLKPFFKLHEHSEIPEGDEFVSRVLKFYNEERISSLKIVSWLLNPSSVVKPEIIALCRTTFKSLLSKGLLEKASSQLNNLSSISIPSTILKENRNEISFSWIHQNISEQKELAKLMFEISSTDYVKISIESRSKLLAELIKNNFGLSNFERYNLDAGTVILAREAFWFRQATAIKLLDLKGLISASVSPANIMSTLNPLKSSDLINQMQSFKSELNHELSSPFKFSWSLLIGFLDSMEILDNTELKSDYSKIAAACVGNGIFKIVFDLLDANNFLSESAGIKTYLKSLFKDVYTAFLIVFDCERSSVQFPLLTEGLIRIFANENSLCEEFWYVDSQFPSRTSVLKHWINRFPHDFTTLIRLLSALASGPVCSEILSDFLLKGFSHIFIERCSDRGFVSEDYNVANEIYNLTVEKSFEIHSCGVGIVLETGSKGVMMAGFNERPMVNWSLKISLFHFLLRVLQISQDFSVNYFILDFFEKLMSHNEGFSSVLFDNLEASAPLFTEPKVNNLPLTLIGLLEFVLEQPTPNALIMSKSLNCLSHFESSLDLDFFKAFLQASVGIMDGITSVLQRCVYNVEIDPVTFEIFDSVLRFSHSLLKICSRFSESYPEECSILFKSLKGSVFSFIIEHVGKWKFAFQVHRIRLLSEVCNLILGLETEKESLIGKNFAFLSALISLLNDVCLDPESFLNGKLFSQNKIDVGVYFRCLTKSIEHACSRDSLAICEFFGDALSVSSSNNSVKSPFNVIAECLSLNFMVLPVLLFFQYVFQNYEFAINVRISRQSLEIISAAMCKWLKSETRESLPKIRSAALAVLNNTACTRPDIFIFIFVQDEAVFVKMFKETVARKALDYETRLVCGILSILWNAVGEFTLVINALKKTNQDSNVLESLVKLLATEWTESQSSLALQTISSVFEVLAVEFCYFNITQNIPYSSLKTNFDPEAFVKKTLLFESKSTESFLAFVESFSVFASSCLALQNESEFNRKAIHSLVLLIEKVLEKSDSDCEYVEITCKVLNFGILQNFVQHGKDCYTLLGHELYSSLISKLISLLAQPTEGDFVASTDSRIETVCTTWNMLSNVIDTYKWNSNQIATLYEMLSNVLTILRHFLALKSKNYKKVSNYLKLLISGIGALINSSDLIHFVRREGVLKTIFSLIRTYRDTEALILFTSGVCGKYSFVAEELVSSEVLESFILEQDDSDELLIEMISLLSVIRIRFDSNCHVSEKICTVLYGCHLQDRFDKIQKTSSNISAKDISFMESSLALLKLLSNSLEKSIEAPATEALLTTLSEAFFKLLSGIVSPDSTSEQVVLISLLISTLLTFTFHSSARNSIRKHMQNLLFPYNVQMQKPWPSQLASALHMIIISTKKFDPETVDFSKQILRLNCPNLLKADLETFMSKS